MRADEPDVAVEPLIAVEVVDELGDGAFCREGCKANSGRRQRCGTFLTTDILKSPISSAPAIADAAGCGVTSKVEGTTVDDVVNKSPI
jgi:hypothetical protein